MGKVYPEEVRNRAVELYRLDEETTYAEVGRDLGIPAGTIRNWCRRADRDEGRLDDGQLTSDERDRLVEAERKALRLEKENRIPKSGDGVLRAGPAVKYAFIERMDRKDLWWFSVALACELLDVSRSGFYDWQARRSRPATPAGQQQQLLLAAITVEHIASKQRYGSPRVHAELVAQGWQIGVNRVARLMRRHGLEGRSGRRRRHNLTRQAKVAPDIPDLLQRDFTATAPDTRWVTDISYVPTTEGWVYLAVLVDLCSKAVVGWAADTYMRTSLVLEALSMALLHRCHRTPPQSLRTEVLRRPFEPEQFTSTEWLAALAWPVLSCTPTAAATAAATIPGSRTPRRSPRRTPSEIRDAMPSATSTASRVLPQPPEPVSVTTRMSATRSLSSARSRSRPMKAATPTGNPLCVSMDPTLPQIVRAHHQEHPCRPIRRAEHRGTVENRPRVVYAARTCPQPRVRGRASGHPQRRRGSGRLPYRATPTLRPLAAGPWWTPATVVRREHRRPRLSIRRQRTATCLATKSSGG